MNAVPDALHEAHRPHELFTFTIIALPGPTRMELELQSDPPLILPTTLQKLGILGNDGSQTNGGAAELCTALIVWFAGWDPPYPFLSRFSPIIMSR